VTFHWVLSVMALTASAHSAAQHPAVRLYAAGSLRSAMTDIAQAFTASSGVDVKATFGASVVWLVAMLAPHFAWSQQPATLTVSGDVAATTALTIDELRKLSPQPIEDTRVAGAKGSSERTPRKYVGVLLRDVLNQVKLKEPEPRGLRKSVVVATARDGYKTVFSWAELYLTAIGDGVYVVYERDSAPLTADEGPLALVSLADTSSGPRHVKWLQAIDVRMIRD